MPQARSETTKTALLNAAFQLFGEKGYAGTSTREIASQANTNIASINYHFGGKQGLRMACAQTISDHLSRLRNQPEALPIPAIVETAESQFEAMLLRQAHLLLSLSEADQMIRFMLREAQERSEAFDHIYEHFFGPMFHFIVNLWEDTGTHTLSLQTTKLITFTFIGQLAYFRIAQPVVTRHMGWQAYGEDEINAILSVLQINIRAIMKAHHTPKRERTS